MALSSELWKANHQRRSCSLPPGSWSSQKFFKQPVELFKLQALVDKGHGCCGRGWKVKCLQGLRDLGEGSTFSRQVSDWHCRAINREFSRALLGLFWSSLWICKLNYILRQPLGKKKIRKNAFAFIFCLERLPLTHGAPVPCAAVPFPERHTASWPPATICVCKRCRVSLAIKILENICPWLVDT